MKLGAKLGTPLALLLSFAWLHTASIAHAEERHEGGGHEAHPGPGHENARPMPPRAAPPKFQPHPPGMHPHGAMVRQHPVRVMRPTTVRWGGPRPFRHWEHPEFARPAYYWDWGAFHNVSCTAEDSYGDQYPVNEETFAGFGLVNMTSVEDDALDRCYQESGGDTSCYLATCTHF